MNYPINTLEDVYKFSLPLYDYLKKSGYEDFAEVFHDLVDDCFATESSSIAAHKKAYKRVLEEVKDLPKEMENALKDSLELMK